MLGLTITLTVLAFFNMCLLSRAVRVLEAIERNAALPVEGLPR